MRVAVSAVHFPLSQVGRQGISGRRYISLYEKEVRDLDLIDAYPPSKPNTVLNITPQGFRMVVERLGKFHSVQAPGLFVAIPLIDRITAVHDMREMCLQVSKQQATTKDNVRLALEVFLRKKKKNKKLMFTKLKGNVYVQIVDVEKATYNIRRPLHAVLRHAEAAMRASVGLFDLVIFFVFY
jgi:regulator of protease activity HflC (stomatin/prohibitin superfamily)